MVAFAIEVVQQQPRWEMRLSLGSAVIFLVAAALSTAVRRAWLAGLSGLSLILAVSQLVRMTKEPLFNGLDIVPILLIACAAILGRSAFQRRRGLELGRAQARSDGEERERRRWARELHDETLQELGAVQVILSTAAATGEPAAMQEAINQARSLITNQITSLRHLIVELRPFALDQLGLAPALETLCQRTKATFGVDAELRVAAGWEGCDDKLSSEAQAHIYRIVQEAVSNAVKHAQASLVLVELDSDDDAISVRVSDDGRGFARLPSTSVDDPELRTMVSTGTGLPAMRERAQLVEGHLRVRSVLGEGTCITLRIPRRGHGVRSGSARSSGVVRSE
ncbi:ATP-binding protein [Streptomyces sp. NPDC007189]|uniref:sensor histidine kinase n=1 Tax=Streptomyces sp. NPDC007189 TaxID=3154315 RepID=UPI003451CDB7